MKKLNGNGVVIIIKYDCWLALKSNFEHCNKDAGGLVVVNMLIDN